MPRPAPALPLRILAVCLLLAVAPLPAAAQLLPGDPAAPSPPVCDAPTQGALACMAGRACECVYARGSIMTGQLEGWRWDCGLLRPTCGPDRQGDPTLNRYDGPLPYAVEIDRSRRFIDRRTIIQPPYDP